MVCICSKSGDYLYVSLFTEAAGWLSPVQRCLHTAGCAGHTLLQPPYIREYAKRDLTGKITMKCAALHCILASEVSMCIYLWAWTCVYGLDAVCMCLYLCARTRGYGLYIFTCVPCTLSDCGMCALLRGGWRLTNPWRNSWKVSNSCSSVLVHPVWVVLGACLTQS